MADPFNPYREWLGLLDCPHPNFYQLLGLTTGEPDVEKIAVAGDRAATRVHAVQPGGQAAARSKLLAEIQFAKTCLLDPSHKAEYDKKLRNASSNAMPSRSKPLPKATPLTPAGPKAQPKPTAPQNGGHAHDLPPGTPAAMQPAHPQPVPGYPPPGQVAAWGAAQGAAYGQPYSPNSAPAGMPGAYPTWPQPGYPAAGVPGPYSGPMVPGPQPGAMTPYNPYGAAPTMGPAPAYGAPYNQPADPGGSGIQLNQPRGLSRAAQALATRRKQETRNILLLGAGSVVVIVGISLCAYVALTANKSDEPIPVAENEPQTPPVDSRVDESADAAPQPAVPLPVTPHSKPVASVPPPAPAPTPAAAPMPVPQPEPPKPAPPQPVVPPTKRELLDLGSALSSAKLALGVQDFDQAATHIARAELLAKLPEHQAMTARLKKVADYAKQFHAAIVAAVQGFQVGDEILVGTSTMYVVVETGPDKIVVRREAQNYTHQLAELPTGLALAIADFRLDETDPVNDVVRGAYRTVHKGKDPDTLTKAQGLWQKAQASGVDISHLMPFLTDDYNLVKDE